MGTNHFCFPEGFKQDKFVLALGFNCLGSPGRYVCVSVRVSLQQNILFRLFGIVTAFMVGLQKLDSINQALSDAFWRCCTPCIKRERELPIRRWIEDVGFLCVFLLNLY